MVRLELFNRRGAGDWTCWLRRVPMHAIQTCPDQPTHWLRTARPLLFGGTTAYAQMRSTRMPIWLRCVATSFS